MGREDIDEIEYEKYRKLFKAVLAQAAHDAFINRKTTKEAKLNRDRARCFLSGGADLRQVCDIAEVSYARIVEVMGKISKSNNFNYKRLMDLIK